MKSVTTIADIRIRTKTTVRYIKTSIVGNPPICTIEINTRLWRDAAGTDRGKLVQVGMRMIAERLYPQPNLLMESIDRQIKDEAERSRSA